MDIQIKTITLINENPILTLDISPNGEQLVIGQQGDYFGNANLTLWSLKETQLIAEIEKIKFTSIESARFTGDGKKLVYVKSVEDVCLYNIETQEHLNASLKTENVAWLATSKKSHRLVTAGIVTEVWDMERLERVWTLPKYRALPDFDLKPAVADITPDGTRIAVASKEPSQILIYDIDKNEVTRKLEEAPVQAHWASFGPDLRYFAVIGELAQGIFVWELETGERHLPHIFSSEFDGYWSLCFHPNGEYLAVGTLVGYVSLFRLSTGEIIVSQKVHEGRVWDLAFTPDGKKLISGGDDGIASILELNNLVES
jgi:WD40 repeat protein